MHSRNAHKSKDGILKLKCTISKSYSLLFILLFLNIGIIILISTELTRSFSQAVVLK